MHLWPDGLAPYAVARSELSERGSHPLLHIDPTRSASAPFLRSLERLDRAIYAPVGMATPRWALYDCAALPGTVFGLCASPEDLPEPARAALAAEGHTGPVPLNAVFAIPTVEAGHWLVYAVCGLHEVVDTQLPDLRAETLRAALAWLGAREVSAVCQWAGDHLTAHLRQAVVEVRASWMPTHDHPASCCLYYATESAPSPPTGSRAWVSSGDEAALQDLQSRIEDGRRYLVADHRAGANGSEYALCERTSP
jgi:hypothetical protein